ncbi:MAG: hypothetical protein ACPGUV_08030 [Polyangiales bacterium]
MVWLTAQMLTLDQDALGERTGKLAAARLLAVLDGIVVVLRPVLRP